MGTARGSDAQRAGVAPREAIMLGEREVSAAVGTTAYGTNGEKLGTVEHFFSDDRTGAPTWVAVATGLFGTRHSIAPAVDASFSDGRLQLPVTAEALKSAPPVPNDHLSPEDEDDLRRHYGGGDGDTAPAVEPAAAAADDGAMIRSEEQVRVGTERVPATRARLVKYVVTEDVTITVPIRREEIRVEEVPLDATDDQPGEVLVPADGSVDTGGRLPDEIVLHAERPVVSVEVVPVERVRLRTEVVQGTETVTQQVQREQIAVDQHAAPPPGA
jgi:stress response protein YsnF